MIVICAVVFDVLAVFINVFVDFLRTVDALVVLIAV